MTLEGIIFDYGGTLDTGGVHWSEVISDAYRALGPSVDALLFREAYVYAERELARVPHILPQDDFITLLRKKINLQLAWMETRGVKTDDRERCAAALAAHCDRAARRAIDAARPVLEALAGRYRLVVVSNFYGNLESVLRGYGVRRYFEAIFDSTVEGVRKPSPGLFMRALSALGLPPARVLVVGDSLTNDIAPALALGCPAVHLKGRSWASAASQPLPTGHYHTITALSELPPLVTQC